MRKKNMNLPQNTQLRETAVISRLCIPLLCITSTSAFNSDCFLSALTNSDDALASSDDTLANSDDALTSSDDALACSDDALTYSDDALACSGYTITYSEFTFTITLFRLTFG